MAKLPRVSSSVPRDVQQFNDRVREAFDAQEKLIAAVQAEIKALAAASAASTSGGVDGTGGQGGVGSGVLNYTVEAPSAPTGVTALGAMANIIVSWDEPDYSGHSHAEVWAAEAREDGGVPALGDAVLVGMSPGRVFAHAIGGSATRWYWVRFVNIEDAVGAYNAVVGVEASTSPDPAFLLELLEGQITESQLFQDLGARIDLVDGDPNLTGSVAQRIATETQNRIDALAAETQARGTAITNEQTLRENADSALASDISALTATTGDNAAAILAEQTARTSADSALASDISALTATTGDNAAAILAEQTARTSADSALASDITTVTASAGDNAAAIQTEATTRATQTGDLFAQYTVKIDLNGYVSGYGLASSAVDGVPTSDFIVRADNFAIGTPGGTTPAPTVPFIVRTTPTTINGQSVPAGTYIEDAFIANGAITTAKIGLAVIDESHIANATILDAYIQQLTASQIDTRGLTIKDAFGNVILGSGTGLDWSNVAGANKPADNANYVTDTNQLTDGASLGSTATWSSVSGTGKPANNADVTSANTAAAIAGQGIFATAPKLTSGNISTYISNLAVDTLQIAGNAVTVPDYKESPEKTRENGAAGWDYNIFVNSRPTISLSVAAPVLIVWMAEQGYPQGSSPRWAWRVKKNGAEVDSRTTAMYGQNDQPSGCFLVSCSAGTNYFDFDWYGDAQQGSITAVVKMWVMAAQK